MGHSSVGKAGDIGKWKKKEKIGETGRLQWCRACEKYDEVDLASKATICWWCQQADWGKEEETSAPIGG